MTLTYRSNLYHLIDIDDLGDAVQAEYKSLSSISVVGFKLGRRNALLFHGSLGSIPPDWATVLRDLTGVKYALAPRHPAALVVVRDTKQRRASWAIAYGMGFRMLEGKYIDKRWGLRIAARSMMEGYVNTATKAEIGNRARVVRSSQPIGATLRGLGLRDLGEIVTSVGGTAQFDRLAVGSSPTPVVSSDSLKVRLATSPARLLSDLDSLSALGQASGTKQALRQIEAINAVTDRNLLNTLNKNLKAEILKTSSNSLGISWPHMRTEEMTTPSAHKFYGLGRGQPLITSPYPCLQHVLAALKRKSPHDPLQAMWQVKIQTYGDGGAGDELGSMVPVARWIHYSTTVDRGHYCLFDGTWYAIDAEYHSTILRHVGEIFDRPWTPELPDWDTQVCRHEIDYNRFATQFLNQQVPQSAINLDRKMVQTLQHPRGFEACDILTHDRDFVHVKHVDRSAAASHLFAQALVSADALRYDAFGRFCIMLRIRRAGGNPQWVPNVPKRIVLALARRTELKPCSLFPFTQVTLCRLDELLQGMDASLIVRHIKMT